MPDRTTITVDLLRDLKACYVGEEATWQQAALIHCLKEKGQATLKEVVSQEDIPLKDVGWLLIRLDARLAIRWFIGCADDAIEALSSRLSKLKVPISDKDAAAAFLEAVRLWHEGTKNCWRVFCETGGDVRSCVQVCRDADKGVNEALGKAGTFRGMYRGTRGYPGPEVWHVGVEVRSIIEYGITSMTNKVPQVVDTVVDVAITTMFVNLYEAGMNSIWHYRHMLLVMLEEDPHE